MKKEQVRKCIASLAMLVPAVWTQTRAESFPSQQPVQFIVPFAAGSAIDLVARAMQPAFSAKLGQNVVVRNKPGASGTMGTEYLSQAKPDGYTVGILAMGATVMVPHMRKLPYSLGDLDFICEINASPVFVMVAPKSPFKSIQSFLDYGRKNPRKVFYGSPGTGTPDHINMANFLRQNGVSGTNVPYQSSGAAAVALLSNQLTAVANTSVMLRAHNLRPLVVLSKRRLKDFPDVPTAAEIGPPVVASVWSVAAVPKGTPADVEKKLQDACKATLQDPQYAKIATNGGFAPAYLDSAATTKFVHSEFDRFGPMMKAEGLTAN